MLPTSWDEHFIFISLFLGMLLITMIINDFSLYIYFKILVTMHEYDMQLSDYGNVLNERYLDSPDPN